MSFDWIQHRRSCTAMGKLKELADVLEKDVERANALELQERGSSTYNVIRNFEHSIPTLVLRELSDSEFYGKAQPIGAVFFSVTSETNIEVAHHRGNLPSEKLFRVIITREPQTCHVQIQETTDGEEDPYSVELWQISEKTLGRLILTS